jgi:UDP-arabinose 4-epimerase
MLESGVPRIVFSSTAAVYGHPRQDLIPEDHPTVPLSPYGESKLMVERLLHWYGSAYGLQWIALRYFNAAGADPDGETGEMHHPETHLIPLAVAAAHGEVPELELFGTDYATPDGTAVRDYIHVADLASAHVKAVERLMDRGANCCLNLGTGHGHTVHQVIRAVEQIGRTTVPVRLCPRRAGDAPVLVADASRAFHELNWRPQSSSLESIVQTAWQWYTRSRRESGPLDGDVNLEAVASSD